MFRQLLSRRDLRREVIALAAATLIIIFLALSHRKPAPVARPTTALPVLASARAGRWTLDLVRFEKCPPRQIAVALIQVRGPSLPGNRNPVDGGSFAGLGLEGGIWTGTAKKATTVGFAGAGGKLEAGPLPRGAGLAILRFRGNSPDKPVQLCLKFLDSQACFPPLSPLLVPPEPNSPLGLQFGH